MSNSIMNEPRIPNACPIRKPKMRWKLGIVASLLGGGTVFDACEVRFHDAVIGGSKQFIASLLDPAEFLQGASLDLSQASSP